MSIRLKRDKEELLEKLRSGKVSFAQDEDSIMLVEPRPGNWPMVIIRFWNKDEFLE